MCAPYGAIRDDVPRQARHVALAPGRVGPSRRSGARQPLIRRGGDDAEAGEGVPAAAYRTDATRVRTNPRRKERAARRRQGYGGSAEAFAKAEGPTSAQDGQDFRESLSHCKIRGRPQRGGPMIREPEIRADEGCGFERPARSRRRYDLAGFGTRLVHVVQLAVDGTRRGHAAPILRAAPSATSSSRAT